MSFAFRVLVILINAFLANNIVFGQEYPQPAPDQYEIDKTLDENRINPQTAEFADAAEKLRDHLKLMRAIFVRFSVNDDPTKDADFLADFNELINSGFALHRDMTSAALAEYKQGTSEKKKIADMLARLVKRETEADRYEGIAEIADVLATDGYPEPDMRRQVVTIGLATNRHDLVRKHIDQLITETGDEATFVPIRDSLSDLEALWHEEIEYQKQDAAGEPLPRVVLNTTKGAIELELFENQAPETVANFINLIERGFYDGKSFHRVVEHFAAQGGCPYGDGTGDDGYWIYGERHKPNARNFFRGTIGMALAGTNVDSGGTQFFITFFPATELNASFTAFGRVVRGIEVLGNLTKVDPEAKEKEKDEPAQPVDEIISAKVISKRDHAYEPNKIPR
ncbi:MAG: peptidylprolyl isomerase [Planctomycetales bacterium]|nr:peptidylprolyl isomerase [Planctomycetales bacterium]